MEVRRAREDDFEPWFELVRAVAGEGRWIGEEPPVDRDRRREGFRRMLSEPSAEVLVADPVGRDDLAGAAGVEVGHGVAGLGMWVAAAERGRGIGTRLMEACVSWARQQGAHKVVLEVWPHNGPAISLYRKMGFAVEGRRRRHYRRRNGELWDVLEMGLVLDWSSPGSSHGDAGL